MKKTDLVNDRTILNDFLKTWSFERVEKMSLDEYVNVKDTETFCQYIETKTRSLGSIKGLNSIKFGIYKRGNISKKPKKAVSDLTHSWLSYYGDEKLTAFERIKSDLIKVIVAAQRQDFDKIDDVHLYSIFKWKIAFLYSNEGFIPIYNKEALHLIASNLGLKINAKTKYSEIHKFIALTKPTGISVYDYMRKLYFEYRIEQNIEKNQSLLKRKSRKGTKSRNMTAQHRKGTGKYVAEQFHNELQEKLKIYLTKIHGDENVIFEENYIDVKVNQPNEIHYYEVKTAGFAEDCIKHGIGQLLSYTFFENDTRKKRLIIFGKNKPTASEKEFISFVKRQFQDIEFDYLSLKDIEDE